jgi:hypothetical protein
MYYMGPSSCLLVVHCVEEPVVRVFKENCTLYRMYSQPIQPEGVAARQGPTVQGHTGSSVITHTWVVLSTRTYWWHSTLVSTV